MRYFIQIVTCSLVQRADTGSILSSQLQSPVQHVWGELSLCQVRVHKQGTRGEERGPVCPETSKGAPLLGASRRGSQPVLGEGLSGKCPRGKCCLKGGREVFTGWRWKGGRDRQGRPACSELRRAGRRGQQCLGRLPGLAERGSGSCERRGSPGGHLQGSGPARLAAAGGLCTGRGWAGRKAAGSVGPGACAQW